ncbi:MAG: lipid-A-disaccharide synthase [Alphaproteobacteria bacterium]|nr:lipid-A-disaccharide synthase [Alphaproteobacteria bacterium]
MSKNIYLIAGEASGDVLGSSLMKALKEKDNAVTFSGIGGALMEEHGMSSQFPMEELSLMGIVEILPNLKNLIGRINQTAQHIIETKPDIVVSIDAPDFSFRVQKKVRKALGYDAPKLVHYVAPTVWAWRPKRAKKIAGFLDALICLFDFEPPYFEKEGLKAIGVGHPMMESGLVTAEASIVSDKPKLGVLFGSRKGEVKRLAPILIDALKEVVHAKPDVQLIVPTLPHLNDELEEQLQVLDVPKHIVVSPKNKWEVFKSCDAAMAVSGTVGLELAAANVPHLIVYNMSGLTWQILKRVIKTRFAHLANIILDKEVVPEFIQDNCQADIIAAETIKLLNDDQVRIAQQNAFEDVRAAITGQNGEAPSMTAASFLLSL